MQPVLDSLLPGATMARRIQALAESRTSAAHLALRELCEWPQPRLAGSPGMARAQRWALNWLSQAGFSSPHLESVRVPLWERGELEVEVLPGGARLHAVSLGLSEGTPPEGLVVPLRVISSLDELALPDRPDAPGIRGAAILLKGPFEGYDEESSARMYGASEAARMGAAAFLMPGMRSRTHPATGLVQYVDDAPRIPAISLPSKDVDSLVDLVQTGKAQAIRIRSSAQVKGWGDCANVVVDWPGQSDEFILLGAHLDAWDLGQGAFDNGIGCILAMEAIKLVADLGMPLRRGIRLVLFTGEETGTQGAVAYEALHQAEIYRHAAAVELDFGQGPAGAFAFNFAPGSAVEMDAAHYLSSGLQEAAEALGLGPLKRGFSHPDLFPLLKRGIPVFGLDQPSDDYWQRHHTPLDLVRDIDASHLAHNLAALASLMFTLAGVSSLAPRS